MNKTEHLLTVLAEECAEVIQAVSKSLRFGLDTTGPDSLGSTNADDISRELNEVFAVMEMLEDLGVLPFRPRAVDIARKKAAVLAYMEFAQEIGTLTGDEDA